MKYKLLTTTKQDINKIFDGKKNLEIDIPIETKIKMLKVDDFVKSKLVLKLKELKSKGDDNGKIRQYLEGILSVPFGTYIKEEIFMISENLKNITDLSLIEFIYEYDTIIKGKKNIYLKTINNIIPQILKKKKENAIN